MDKKINVLRTDNGGELCGKERQHGIDQQFRTPYMPQQNGVAKRMDRTLMEKDRIMLSDAGLSQDYWIEAFNTTC